MSRQRAITEALWFLAIAAVAIGLTFYFGGRYVEMGGFLTAVDFVPFSVEDIEAWCIAVALLLMLLAVRGFILLVRRRSA